MIHLGLRGTASLATTRRAPAVALAATAAAVVVLDGVSKALALHLLAELDGAPNRLLRLGILYNTELAGGLSFGVESAAISAAAALLILGLSLAVCGSLAAHDPAAPLVLGLIVGAGIANATDALAPPAGVVDWIALDVGGGIVLNLADLAVVVGVGLCARTIYRLAVAIRQERTARR